MYLDISPQLHKNKNDIIYLIFQTRIVEVNFPKKKWIMGVCDLNY